MNIPVGATYHPSASNCQFCVWAPEAESLSVEISAPEEQSIPMKKGKWGYWKTEPTALSEGALYKYKLNNEQLLPDPASRYQPEGPHGPSAVVSPDYDWQASEWRGIEPDSLIIYELHVGTFSEEGTFEGVEKKLDYLLDLGINAIEIMPIAQFPGNRNWGYDGVDPFAVQDSYGGPEAFRRLVDACHQREIAVILDVVYNHMGPEGNYLSQWGPYFTDKYNTPWGQALNFDDAYCDGVRNYFLQNALMWLRDYKVDGLRLDAVHAIKDLSARHFLQDLSKAVYKLSREEGHRHFLIAEVDLNDTRYISPEAQGGYALDSQWIDEFHHAWHSWLTGEKKGYYEDFGEFEHLEKAYKDTYIYNGIYSPHRKKIFGSNADNHPYHQFVVFIQNHDQVGNRMLGERLTDLVSYDALKLAAAAYLLSPYQPMLFMGEEWAEEAPFNYFVSHTDKDLVEAVRQGRKREFAAFHGQGDPPDPQAEETFLASKLNWNFKENPHQKAMWNLYKELIHLRKTHPSFQLSTRDSLEVLSWPKQKSLGLHKISKNSALLCLLNSGSEAATVEIPQLKEGYRLLLNTDDKKWQGSGQNVPLQLTGSEKVKVAPFSAYVFEASS